MPFHSLILYRIVWLVKCVQSPVMPQYSHCPRANLAIAKYGLMYCVQSESDDALLRHGYLKFFKMAAGRHPGFYPTGNRADWSAVPRKPILKPNIKWIGWTVAELWPFAICEKYTRLVAVGPSVGRQYHRHQFEVNIHTSYTDLIYSSIATLGT